MSNAASRDRALIVLTSHGELGDTGRSTGFYLPEVAHPWKVFAEAGLTVDLVSVKGGEPPMDGHDPSDPVQQRFLEDPEMSAKLKNTPKPSEVDPSRYGIVLYAGGHGVMWDFPGNAELAAIGRQVYEQGGVVAAVCHGPAALVNLTLSDGRPLVAGKAFAAFTNEEEEAVGLADTVPFLLQEKLEERGGVHVRAPKFQPCVVVNERLATGQNPASAAGVAEAAVKLLAG